MSEPQAANDEFVEFLQMKVRALGLHPLTHERAGVIVGSSLLTGKDSEKRLHREWVNDALSRDDLFDEAVKSPDENYLSWLSSRVKSPYHVSYRTIEKVSRTYTFELANLMYFQKWGQEIAWAQRLRADDNDRVSVLSFLFHAGAVADPSKAFIGLSESYVMSLEEGVAMSSHHQNHLLTPAQILMGEGEQGWQPLFLGYAERTVSTALSKMLPAQIDTLARMAREAEAKDRRVRAAKRIVDALRKSPLSRLAGFVFEATRFGLGSNDLVALEAAFHNEIETGSIEISGGDTYSAFMRYVQTHSADRLPPPTTSDAHRRIASIRSLNNEWLNDLSSDLRQFGGADGRKLAKWRTEVMRGVREAPVDPFVDYAFFLVADVISVG